MFFLQESENSNTIYKDAVDVLVDAAAGEVTLKTFENALQAQMVRNMCSSIVYM